MSTQQRKVPAFAHAPPVGRRNFEPPEHDHGLSVWDDWFRHAPAGVQAEVLALAGQQGFLYSHQLPPLPNGAAKSRSEPAHSLWQELLAGRTERLVPALAKEFEPFDHSLTTEQTFAVARALASPDVCLFQIPQAVDALPVLTEIVEQETQRRHRVAILANQATRLDGLVQRLQDRSQLFVLRYPTSLGADWAHGGTDAQKQAFRERILTRARTAHRDTEERCLRRGRETRIWDALRDLLQQVAQANARLEQTRRDRAAVAQHVERSCQEEALGEDAFAIRFRDACRRGQEQLEAVQAELQQHAAERARLKHEWSECKLALEQLEPSRAALSQGRWWTPSYWKARRSPDVLADCDRLEARSGELTRAIDALEQPCADLEKQRAESEVRCAGQRQSLIAEEIARRESELDHAIRGLEQERTRIEETWREGCRELTESESRPASLCEEALQSAHAAWQARRQADEEACKFAGSWFAFLDGSIDQFLGRMPGFAPVVAGTARVLAQHPDFTDAPEPWDLLMILDADESSEPDVLRLARKARRVLLLGGPLPPARNGLLSSSTFHRLWQHLVGDRSHLHYAWRREGERWNCHLRSVAEEERQHLETENLADFPEIELRILALPGKRPVLAQVLFPRGMDLAQAKAFIFSELQELALEGGHGPVFWRETADAWVLHCGALEHEPGPAIEIDRGVRVHLRGDSTQTAAVHFNKAQGWSHTEAAEWVTRLLNIRDLGRVFAFAAKIG